ncbi:hypothetical protein SNOG_16321 [Parastagonospora nodorum SN15]|uniref:Uncharacterized protein n=1 Tax=Phaeosphaeria nodorum (strain SN15 / ATCC MYA-4574 / FGSC 10173) TaxID=321614 RepID=Q0TW08_PHANO|nr:hypothetical protein SNOG_16321 [Parastagonospora nodorum SN15]EAT76307.1 hypothetical protein SNOG_16321 [Parastagonospora nodorum SN15]
MVATAVVNTFLSSILVLKPAQNSLAASSANSLYTYRAASNFLDECMCLHDVTEFDTEIGGWLEGKVDASAPRVPEELNILMLRNLPCQIDSLLFKVARYAQCSEMRLVKTLKLVNAERQARAVSKFECQSSAAHTRSFFLPPSMILSAVFNSSENVRDYWSVTAGEHLGSFGEV